jgi:hypothetical protein
MIAILTWAIPTLLVLAELSFPWCMSIAQQIEDRR